MTSPRANFQPFSRLPTELRIQIWELAVPLTYTKPGTCILTPEHLTPGSKPVQPLLIHGPDTVLLRTSTEARASALAVIANSPRLYDPAADLLYITPHNFRPFVGSVCFTEDWPSTVRHLALAHSCTNTGLWLPLALRSLHSLETLSVVYPHASGIISLNAEVAIPARRPLWLRRFTQKELDEVRVGADYRCETGGGTIPMRWTAVVRNHIESVRNQLSAGCRSIATRDMAQHRNYKHEKLALSIEARCFESVS